MLVSARPIRDRLNLSLVCTCSTPSPPHDSLVLLRSGATGFCAISRTLPLPDNEADIEGELDFPASSASGMNVTIDRTAHCIAAEPHTTFLRIGVVDRGQEVAFEGAVLGRLRHGFRVFHLRSMQGTRIELAYLLVRISVGSEPNLWPSTRQLRVRSALTRKVSKMSDHISKLVDENEELKQLLVQSGTTSQLVASGSASKLVESTGSASQSVESGSASQLVPSQAE
jgi:hypothetical protein